MPTKKKQTTAQKSSKAIYGALGKTDLFHFPPEALLISDDPESPVFDRRSREQPEATFVANIARIGIQEPVLARRNVETGGL